MTANVFEDFVDLPALAEEIRSEDPERRKIAVLSLADSGEPDVVPLLGLLVRDDDTGVRRQVAIALGTFDGQTTARYLIALLGDNDSTVATLAAESLSALKDASAAPNLVEALRGEASAFVRQSLLKGLKELRSPLSLEPALAALSDPDAAVRLQAVGVIAYLKREETVPALQSAAGDDDPLVRRAVVNALAGSRLRVAQITVMAALADDSWPVREAAAEALGSMISEDLDIAGLIAALDDPYWQVRLKAIRSLGQLHADEAALRIAQSLKHREPNLRKEAAAALGQIASLATRAHLEKAAHDPDADVRKNVRWALTQIDTATAITPPP